MVRGERSESRRTSSPTEETERVEVPVESINHRTPPSRSTGRSKLSVNVNNQISERLRGIAYTYRLSESSIVEIALTIFFARGDDALLGVMLKQLGATRRSK